jgi:nicotinate-nucleotide pyrophosphorylase
LEERVLSYNFRANIYFFIHLIEITRMKSYHVDDFIQAALIEDIREGDHTTLACIPEEASGSAVLLIKQAGILAGIRMAERVFHLFDPTLAVKVMIPDGSHIQVGDQALRVTGSQRSILQTERLVLNILQRMSGIATVQQNMLIRSKARKPGFWIPGKPHRIFVSSRKRRSGSAEGLTIAMVCMT